MPVNNLIARPALLQDQNPIGHEIARQQCSEDTVPKANTIAVQNVNHPDAIKRVDERKYVATRNAILGVLPPSAPGLTFSELTAKVKPLLPADLFPGGEKAAWWAKTVQLDLEAKGLVAREESKPLRVHRLPVGRS